MHPVPLSGRPVFAPDVILAINNELVLSMSGLRFLPVPYVTSLNPRCQQKDVEQVRPFT